jgi:hypothetical protein
MFDGRSEDVEQAAARKRMRRDLRIRLLLLRRVASGEPQLMSHS